MRFPAKFVVAVLGVLPIVLALCGCRGVQEGVTPPSEAKREARRFLDETMRHEDLAWPDVPEPVVLRCSIDAAGIRFQYLVHIKHSGDARTLARSFEDYWDGRGFDVTASEGDLGNEYGTVYSAIAHGAAGFSGAVAVSRVGVNL